MTTAASSDRIERQVFLKAPRSRVWRALTDSAQFGEWFGIRADAAFTPGARVRAVVTHPQHKGLTFDMLIEQVVPEHLFSWRWHPNAIDGSLDYSKEPTTLVVFQLEETQDGTLVKLVESGFDAVPPDRRLAAYRGNTEGWDYQMKAIEHYVSQG